MDGVTLGALLVTTFIGFVLGFSLGPHYWEHRTAVARIRSHDMVVQLTGQLVPHPNVNKKLTALMAEVSTFNGAYGAEHLKGIVMRGLSAAVAEEA